MRTALIGAAVLQQLGLHLFEDLAVANQPVTHILWNKNNYKV